FIAMAFDPVIVKKLGFNAHSLEGYLFPDTYYFEKKISDYDILKKMVDAFRKKIMIQEIMVEAKKSNLSLHEIVTLASVIEKETGKEEERPLISAVFHNRLRKKMRLQSDPTVIYAIRNFDGNLRKKDLRIDSPYNTYRYAGLPPGPIANPGLSSIKTAMQPAKANYLYFVSKKDGEHKFSSTLKEHNQAVLKYQKRRRPVN
ncbi:MAG: endolytic transglycosylase MltG, partial [Nitrospinota bacterium]|nr:endolytic transglycosylase MltG [Nitrospinota bacterium]